MIDPLEKLAKAIMASGRKDVKKIWEAEEKITRYNSEKTLIDLARFCYDLSGYWKRFTTNKEVWQAAKEVYEGFEESADNFVTNKVNLGKNFEHTGGVSIFFMRPGSKQLSQQYEKLEFAKQCSWWKMIDMYHNILNS